MTKRVRLAIIGFSVLRWASRKLAARFEAEVTAWLQRKAHQAASG